MLAQVFMHGLSDASASTHGELLKANLMQHESGPDTLEQELFGTYFLAALELHRHPAWMDGTKKGPLRARPHPFDAKTPRRCPTPRPAKACFLGSPFVIARLWQVEISSPEAGGPPLCQPDLAAPSFASLPRSAKNSACASLTDSYRV